MQSFSLQLFKCGLNSIVILLLYKVRQHIIQKGTSNFKQDVFRLDQWSHLLSDLPTVVMGNICI